MKRLIIIISLAFLVLLVGLWLGYKHFRRPAKDLPNIVMIGIDALRPDHLGIYGYERPTSPNIDALGRDGVVFENAYSTTTWTLPSIFSVISSLHPSAHGVSYGYLPVPGHFDFLRDENLFSGFLKKDYQVIAIVEGWVDYITWIAPESDSIVIETAVSGADKVSERAIAWLDNYQGEKPFFMFLYYYDVHMPYDPPEDIAKLFIPLSGPFEMDYKLCNQISKEVVVDGKVLEEKVLRDMKNLYDSEIRFTDEQIGRVLDKLKEANLLERAVIVIWADHGEAFVEHNIIGHSLKLYDELIRIPLIIVAPRTGQNGLRVKGNVQHIDIYPTLFEMAGISPSSNIQGKSLLPIIEGKANSNSSIHPDLYTELSFGPFHFLHLELKGEQAAEYQYIQSVISGKWKYILYKVSGREELFDIMADPAETRNLVGDYPEVARALQEKLERHHEKNRELSGVDLFALPDLGEWKRRKEEFKGKISPETQKQLKALGYLP